MKYSQYDLYRSNTELDSDKYKTLLKDALTANQTRLNAIIDAFLSLSVPKDYDGDVHELCDRGLLEIESGNYAEDMLEYAKLIWALPESVSDAVFHVLEQMVEVEYRHNS